MISFVSRRALLRASHRHGTGGIFSLKKALDDAAADCKDKTCTEAKHKCRFLHTLTKVNCKKAPEVPGGPKIICGRKYRPGCFCLKEDEEMELKAVKSAGKEKKE